MIINALGVCENIIEKMHGSVTVCGIYDKCFNVKNQKNELITVFINTDFISTRAIITDYAQSINKLAIKNGENGEFKANKLIFEKLTIDLSSYKTIKTKRSSVKTEQKPYIDEFTDYINQYGKNSVLRDKENIVYKKFINGLIFLNIDNEKLFDSLLGLGAGLTPSCDDFISGLTALFYLTNKNADFNKQLKTYINAKGWEKTTFVSSNLLLDVAVGYINLAIYNLIYSLFNDKTKLKENTIKMINYGSSSGTEVCLGILAGCYYLKEGKYEVWQ